MANIIELFSSIQGEGLYVGTRQIFVRFAGCNLACDYCDTPASRTLCGHALVETVPGQRIFEKITNPVPIADLARRINSFLTVRHHSISLTGGEPLGQAESIIRLAPQLNSPIYLETNGTLVEKLALVLPYIHIISMDLKLPSVTGNSYWQQHYEFLRLATAKDKEVFVKLVITGQTGEHEFKQAIDLVAAVRTSIPFILQPVTPCNASTAVTPDIMLAYQAEALKQLENVRVIPQTHKFMGQL
ncbi:7-carboxy-7-deazaguanine synthase QueE [Sporomusa termitida]|uniref:7-carboxy-7-deazaguanine synthase n=1 Tax=Sporomusa termitida TaxID=2377 RepID=A0A517DTH3_9FIRM|nr:7-carboxy-7-deazaguanine synthase QueE [Sporomusa termitida]QDR80641.1 7-carboxy-7-deazaguanine synthase [Sporomusa termitida]